MKMYSSKERYRTEADQLVQSSDWKYHVWAEELIGKKIYVYPKKRKEIPSEKFAASKTIPNGKIVCKDCMRKLAFRVACAQRVKEIPICDGIFRKRQIQTEKIWKYVMEDGLKFHASQPDELLVEGAEDKWIIKELGERKPALWHNNYVRISTTERYITEGYHRQRYSSDSLIRLLDYIAGYTWQGHVRKEEEIALREMQESQAQKVQAEVQENTEQVEIQQPELSVPQEKEQQDISLEEKRKLPWYRRIIAFFSKFRN